MEIEFTFNVNRHDFSSVELVLGNKLKDIDYQLLQGQNNSVYALSDYPKLLELGCNVKCYFYSEKKDNYDLHMKYQFIVKQSLGEFDNSLQNASKLFYFKDDTLYPLNQTIEYELRWFTSEYLPLLMAIDDEETYDAVVNQVLTRWYQDYQEFCNYYKVQDERFTSMPISQLSTKGGMYCFNQLLMNLSQVSYSSAFDREITIPWEVSLNHLKNSIKKNQCKLIKLIEKAIHNKRIQIRNSTLAVIDRETRHNYSFANLFFEKGIRR